MRAAVQILRKILVIIGVLKLPTDIKELASGARNHLYPLLWAGGYTVVTALAGWWRDAPFELVAMVILVGFVLIYGLVFGLGVLRQRGAFSRQAKSRKGPEMSDQRDAQEPEESRGYVDQRSVTSHNQRGGQTAWEITNIGQQPRTTSKAEAEAVVEALRQYPGEQFDLSAVHGDADAQRVGQQLMEILSQAGWSPQETVLSHLVSDPPADIFVGVPRRTPQADILVKWLEDRGWQPTVEFNEKAERIFIFVGTRS